MEGVGEGEYCLFMSRGCTAPEGRDVLLFFQGGGKRLVQLGGGERRDCELSGRPGGIAFPLKNGSSNSQSRHAQNRDGGNAVDRTGDVGKAVSAI